MRTLLLAGAAATAAMAAAATHIPVLHAATPADPFAHLMGRWVGNAVMTTSSGPANFKCVVTYLARKDGPGMRQNLRCDNGQNFKFQAATDLTVEGRQVKGRWKDAINEIEGTVAGQLTEAGFEVDLAGDFFAAKMAVAGTGCTQSVTVLPASSQLFTELAAQLKKC